MPKTRSNMRAELAAQPSLLKKRLALEAAHWDISMPNYHFMSANYLQTHGVNEAILKKIQVWPAEIGRCLPWVKNNAFSEAYTLVTCNRWARNKPEAQITSFAEQIAPVKILTPTQLKLLYGVMGDADWLHEYTALLLHAQCERLQSTKTMKHEWQEPEYLGAAYQAGYLPIKRTPVQRLIHGTFSIREEGIFNL